MTASSNEAIFLEATMLSPAEQMLYNCVRIKSNQGNGLGSWGTGFYFNFCFERGDCLTLVTNKHVIDGAKELQIRIHIADDAGKQPSGKTELVTIHLSEGGIARHPDAEVDLCAISIGELARPGALAGKTMFAVGLDESLIPTSSEWEEFDAIEEITMVGCPNGLYDDYNGLPMIRKGITASSIAARYENKEEFMIDAACFPGSSGSPVYIYNQIGYFNKKRGGVD